MADYHGVYQAIMQSVYLVDSFLKYKALEQGGSVIQLIINHLGQRLIANLF